MNPSIASTVAMRNTKPAVALANKYGLHPSSHQDLILSLNRIIAEKKEAGLKEIAMIHPDRELILSTAPAAHSSCDGNPSCNCDKKSNANGDTPEETNMPTGAMPSMFQQHQATIITVVAIVAIAYIFKHHS